jgi:prolipoprotein diacylglyceryltransferase
MEAVWAWSPRTWEGWAIIASVIAIGAVIGRVNFCRQRAIGRLLASMNTA